MGSGGGTSAAEVKGPIPGKCGGSETLFHSFRSFCGENLHNFVRYKFTYHYELLSVHLKSMYALF